MNATELAAALERLRPELTAYLTRMVVRVHVAEELVQATAERALAASDRAPADPVGVRRWLFRIATRLGIDERRRHGAWRENLMVDARTLAESRPEFVEASGAMRGNPETATVAAEHLAVCFSCVLGGLPPEQAAALLVREVYGFSVAETAELLEARFAQAKGWIQAARATMSARYGSTCALITKGGVCHQCTELDDFFAAHRGNPLAGTAGDMQSRLEVLRNLGDRLPGPWHRSS